MIARSLPWSGTCPAILRTMLAAPFEPITGCLFHFGDIR